MSITGWDDSIRDFLNKAGSDAPTPGGGSVAALVRALGASITSMVANLSQGAKFADVQPLMRDIVKQMESLSSRCEELLAADIASFQAYMEALKLPKSTDAEKAARAAAMEQAAVGAIEVPLALLKLCLDGLRCAQTITDCSNKNVISDLGISAILFEASAQSALLTIDINLAGLKDAETKRRYADETAALMTEISVIKETALNSIRSKIHSS